MEPNIVVEVGNLRLVARQTHPDADPRLWCVDVTRISDNHRLGPQMWFAAAPTANELAQGIHDAWVAQFVAKHGRDPNAEPPPVLCCACGGQLRSDIDTKYGFDNALWVGLHGGYGMFVDCMADWPINTDDQWLRDENGDDVVDDAGKLVRNPDYVPVYAEERVLPGRPDLECVICHDCAHEACEKLPWLATLIEPDSSHAHRIDDYPKLLAEHHIGWDLQHHLGQNEVTISEED